ncbi:MAG TPA: DUF1016 domain-containing protein [Phycisphaerales bacterium]|nr:DUF1016 domain-containing protein [Phycisphaerales bacterium]
MKPEPAPSKQSTLIGELSSLISTVRGRVAQIVNSELVTLYWQVGHRLRTELLNEQRAEYGKEVVKSAAKALTAEFGRGFDKTNLSRMMTFAELFPDQRIVDALRQQLSWTHLRELIVIDDPLKRQFYIQICCLERWSTRTLKAKINGMLFERTALAKRPTAVIEETLGNLDSEGQMSPDLVFQDPYILDFLGMPADYSESELEAAILREIETFLLELGSGFSFVARQKRLPIGPDDFYLDLLFFHRALRALVAVELKLGRFDARDKGQMELYLRWLDRHERRPGEQPPLGLILCADKNQEQIELLELDDGSIRVANYLTELPPREVLEKKLIQSIEHARLREARQRPASALTGQLEIPAKDQG